MMAVEIKLQFMRISSATLLVLVNLCSLISQHIIQ